MVTKGLRRILSFLYEVKEPPVRILGLILGASLAGFTLFVIYPFDVAVQGDGTLSKIWDSVIVARPSLGIIFFIFGAVLVIANMFTHLYKKTWLREAATLGTIFAWLFLSFLRMLETGWTPVSWLLPLTLAAVTATYYLIAAFGDEHVCANC